MKDQHFYILVGLGVAAVLWVAGKAGAGVDTVATGLNPGSRDNFIYGGIINPVGDIFNDGMNDDDFSLGSWIYDVFNEGTNITDPYYPGEFRDD